MSGGDTMKVALEARIQAERMHTDRVWDRRSRNPQVGEHWMATRRHATGRCQQMLRWIGILGDKELHSVTNASENKHAVAVSLRERRPMDKFIFTGSRGADGPDPSIESN